MFGELLAYIGLFIGSGLSLAGWFWDFTTKDEGSHRKYLTKPGKVAFIATIVVTCVSLIALIHQSIEKRNEIHKTIRERDEFRNRLIGLKAPFDVDRVDIVMLVDNSYGPLNDVIGSEPLEQTRTFIRDEKNSLSEDQNLKLLAMILQSSLFDIELVPEGGYNGNALTKRKFMISPSGGMGLAARIDWRATIHTKSWGKPSVGGWTRFEVTMSGKPVTIGDHSAPIDSFADFRGNTVHVKCTLDKAYLESLVLFSKGRRYPLIDLENGVGKEALPVCNQPALLKVPNSAGWLSLENKDG